jgi:hypothetical protein
MFSKDIAKIALKEKDANGELSRYTALENIYINTYEDVIEVKASDARRMIVVKKKKLMNSLRASSTISADTFKELPEKFSIRHGMLSVEAFTKNITAVLTDTGVKYPNDNIPDEKGKTNVVDPKMLVELIQVMMANVSEESIKYGLEINVGNDGILRMSMYDPSDSTVVEAYQAPIKVLDQKMPLVIQGTRKLDL